jgi:hypothetical protein
MSNVSARQSLSKTTFWSSRREASLNWLALGLLLAAWNASDNDAGLTSRTPEVRKSEARRPEALRGYAFVSVRAANRITPQNR